MKVKRFLTFLLAALLISATWLPLVTVVPAAADTTTTTATISPSDYVQDGLVSLYLGTQNQRAGHSTDATVWEDLIGENHLTIQKNKDNHFTDKGLKLHSAQHNFPQAIVDLVNGRSFTVELRFGEFISHGSSYNTVLNSANDHLALFRRISSDQIEFKFANNGGDARNKISNGLALLQNTVVTITYQVGGESRIYINGELKSAMSAPNAMGADNLYIGHADGSRNFETVYECMRFYNRELTAAEVLANARVDATTQPEPSAPDVVGPTRPTHITVAQPQTKIVGDIAMVRPVNSAEELTALTEAAQTPATAIYTIDDQLNVLADDGSTISTVSGVMEATGYKIVPAFRVNTAAAATALVTYLKQIKFTDCLLVSADASIVKEARKTLPTISGVIDYTETYQDVDALTEAHCLDIRRSMKSNNGMIAILPAAVCAHDTLQYLYDRQINVWVRLSDEPTVSEQYSALLSGAIGVVSDATDALLDVACNQLPGHTMTRVPLNVGHRGIPSAAPENTLEGSILSYEKGASVIELDIYLTADAKVVVMHDGTTGRTCNADLNVESSTLEQLKKLYVNKGYENHETYSQCRIPTLEEYLEYFKDKDCNLFIEIKSSRVGIVPIMKQLIDQYDMYDQCSVITFNEGIMRAMHNNYPEMSVGALCSGYMSGTDPEAELAAVMNFIGKYNATLNPGVGGFDEKDSRAAMFRGISIYPWTFRGDFNTYKNHMLWGYAALTGDNADVFGALAKDINFTLENTTYKAGETLEIALDVTTYAHESLEKKADVIILGGEDLVKIYNSSIEFTGAGEVTLLLAYTQRANRTENIYTLYTQPITLTIEPSDETTAPDTVPETLPETETEPSITTTEGEDSQGCASVMDTAGGITLLIMAAGAILLGQKQKKQL